MSRSFTVALYQQAHIFSELRDVITISKSEKNENKMKMSVIQSELEEASDLDHDIIFKKKLEIMHTLIQQT